MDGGTCGAAPEDDQYNEHHPGTMVFSSFRVTQGVISDCVGMPSWTLRVPRVGWGFGTTPSVADGIPTGDRGNE
jgi:hypothetical protein